MSDRIKNIYNSQAKLYKSQTQDFEFPEWMFDFFISQLIEKKVLDIGCGYGREVSRLRDVWCDAFGIDISQWLLDEADETIQKYLSHWDMTKLTTLYPESSFNWIISSASLVHMDHDVWIQVMKNVFTLLKASGIFFLSLKVDRERKTLEKESISTPWSIKKYVYYDEDEIDEIIKEIWFSMLKTHLWKAKDDKWKILICKK